MARMPRIIFALSAIAVGALFITPMVFGDSPPSDAPASAQPVDLQNTKCPVTGKPVAAGVTEVVNGTVVHFCCPKCPAKYRANPAAYEANLRSEPAVAQRMDQAHASPPPAAPNSPGAPGAPMAMPASGAIPATEKGAAFHDAMRKLWEDHVLWTRLFIVSATSDLADKDATTNRLLRNQEDIGNAIKPMYGDEAGTKLTALLKDHITTAADIVVASKAGDSAKAEEAKKKWVANADEIATFLSAANPTAWPLDAAKAMMREHLDLTTAEVTARLEKNWDADIAAYEKIHEQALKMADMLSDGIRRQFPEKFQ